MTPGESAAMVKPEAHPGARVSDTLWTAATPQDEGSVAYRSFCRALAWRGNPTRL